MGSEREVDPPEKRRVQDEQLRILVARLVFLSGLTVPQIQTRLGQTGANPVQQLRTPLYDKSRRFRPELLMGLDQIFQGRLGSEYPSGALSRLQRTGNDDELSGYLGHFTNDSSEPASGPASSVAESRNSNLAPQAVEAAEVVTPSTVWRRSRLWRLVAGVVAVGVVLATWYYTRPITLDGAVSCASGAAVTGVWVVYAAPINWGDFAESPIRIGSSNSYSFTARTPLTVLWAVRVGCGGTSQTWAVRTSSGFFTTNPVGLVCEDRVTPPRVGTCAVVS